MRYLAIIFLILIVSPASAGFWVPRGATTASTSSTVGCTGTSLLSAHFENSLDITAGTPAGCSVGDETFTVASLAEFSNTQAYDGTYSLYIPSSVDYLSLDITSKDILDTDDFLIEARVYITTFNSGGSIFLAEGTSASKVNIKMLGTSSDITMSLIYNVGGAKSVTIATSSGRAEDEWFFVRARAKIGVAGNDAEIEVCDADGVSNCVSTEGDLDLVALTTAASAVWIGNAESNLAQFYIDAFSTESTSGY